MQHTMTLSQDVQQLLQGVHHFLESVLSEAEPLPPTTECDRQRLLEKFDVLRLRYPAIFFPAKNTDSVTSAILLPVKNADSATSAILPAKTVKRSSSLSSSRSSSSGGSSNYTTNSYTSNSYTTSNGYSSYDGGAGGGASKMLEQEDIYEEFDAVQMRINDGDLTSCPTANTSSTTTTTTTTSVSSSTPFFSNLRNSLSEYGKKDKQNKKDKKNKDKHKDDDASSNSKTENKQQSKKDKKSKDKNEKGTKASQNDAAQKSKKKKESVRESVSENDSENKENIIDAEDGEIWDEGEEGSNVEEFDEEREKKGDDAVGDEVEESSTVVDVEHDGESSYMEGLQPLAFSSAVACCARHGVLHKRTKALLRHWRAFHCVVSTGVLFLFAKETDQRQRKSLELCWYDVRVATAEEPQQGSATSPYLELVAPGRKTHTFMARSINERDAWIQAMGQYTKNKATLPQLLTCTLSSDSDMNEATTKLTTRCGSSSDVNTSKYNNNAAGKNTGYNTLSGTSRVRSEKVCASKVVSPLAFADRFSFTSAVADEDTFSTTGSQDDTFSSDEMYEEVNVEDLRGASGPSLSEMLEPHLFPNTTLSAYYTVPDEDAASVAISSFETSTPKKLSSESLNSASPCTPPVTPKGGRQAPARPPPPTPNNMNKSSSSPQISKNNSALHQILSPSRQAIMKALPGITSTIRSPSSKLCFPSPISGARLNGSPTAACKKLAFGTSGPSLSRPLPATPNKTAAADEGGEIYCEIEEEDYYEENETDGVNLMSGVNDQMSINDKSSSFILSPKKCYSANGSPPPLPSRGPPPVPNVVHRVNIVAISDLHLFEDYDIPGEMEFTVQQHHPSDNSSYRDSLNKDGESVTMAPMPQDLEFVMPNYPINITAMKPIENPPIPEKGSPRLNVDTCEDEDVYKVPTTSYIMSDDIYKVPPSVPVPVRKYNDVSNLIIGPNSSVDTNKTDAAEVYQCPAADAVPVNPNNSDTDSNSASSRTNKNLINGHIHNKNNFGNPNTHTILNQISATNLNGNNVIADALKKYPLATSHSTHSASNKTCSSDGINKTDNIPVDRSSNKSLGRGVFGNNLNSSLPASKINKNGGGKKNNNITVKERIAFLNKQKCDDSCELTKELMASEDDFVVMVDNQEIRLNQANKRAFLNSTLNFSNQDKYSACSNIRKNK